MQCHLLLILISLILSILAHVSSFVMPHQGVGRFEPLNRHILDVMGKKSKSKKAKDDKKKTKSGGDKKAGKNKKKSGRIN